MNTEPLKQLWKAAFGDPDSAIDTFFATAFSPDRCRYLEEEGRIVSALYWLDCQWEGQKIAYLYAVATDPACRGRGLASRLLTQTHSQLKVLGYAGAALKPVTGRFPFYGRLGYETAGYIARPEVCAGEPIPIRRLSAREHARLRRSLLPENSVIQEGPTLAYLHSFAQVYAGGGGMLCLEPDSGTVLEYLGDPAAAPGLLGALGIPRAQLQMPGSQIPYTMYLPLNCTKTPGYLGITLE